MLPSQLQEGQSLVVTNTPEGETGPALLFIHEYGQRAVWLIHLPDPRVSNPDCSVAEEEEYLHRQIELFVPEATHDDLFQHAAAGEHARVF